MRAPLLLALFATACLPQTEKGGASCGPGTVLEGDICVGDTGDSAAPADTADSAASEDSDSGGDADTGGGDTDSGGSDSGADSGGSDTGGGDTSASYDVCADGSAPFTTIQDALDAAATGATINVCPGTYRESVIITAKGVSLVAPEGPDVTIIAPSARVTVLTIRDVSDPVLVEGFTLSGGYSATDVGGLLIKGVDATIRDCIISDNEGWWGGGAAIYDSNAVFDGVSFLNNMGDNYGGGLYVSGGSPVVERSSFEGNGGGLDGAALYLYDTTAEIANNTFVKNAAALRGAVVELGNSGALFINNLLAYNTCSATEGTSTWALQSSGAAIYNNIVYDNATLGIFANDSTIQYNLSSGNLAEDYLATVDATDLTADPRFTDPESGDFTLTALSPAMDAGNPAAGYDDADGTRNDMGVFGGPLGVWP